MKATTLKFKIQGFITLQNLLEKAFNRNFESELVKVRGVATLLVLSTLRPLFLKLSKETKIYFYDVKGISLQPAELCALYILIEENMAKLKEGEIDERFLSAIASDILEQGLMKGIYLETTQQRVVKEQFAKEIMRGEMTFDEAYAKIQNTHHQIDN